MLLQKLFFSVHILSVVYLHGDSDTNAIIAEREREREREMAMAHILVIPFPAQGHVNPLMLLSRKIVKHGFKITFVNTDFNHNRVVGALDSLMDSNISLVSIPDGLGPEDDRNELGKLCEAMLHTMPEKLEELINYINASNGDDKISCIVADAGGMGWAIEVGIKMGIKRAFFWPATAASLALQVSIPRLIDDGIIKSDGKIIVILFDLCISLYMYAFVFFECAVCPILIDIILI